MLETLDRNWPSLTEALALKGVEASNLTDEQLAVLRRKGGQAPTKVGGRVLVSMGGGQSPSHLSIQVVMQCDWVVGQLRALERMVVAAKERMFAEAEARAVRPRRPVTLHLRIVDEIAYATATDSDFGCNLGAWVL